MSDRNAKDQFTATDKDRNMPGDLGGVPLTPNAFTDLSACLTAVEFSAKPGLTSEWQQ